MRHKIEVTIVGGDQIGTDKFDTTELNLEFTTPEEKDFAEWLSVTMQVAVQLIVEQENQTIGHAAYMLSRKVHYEPNLESDEEEMLNTLFGAIGLNILAFGCLPRFNENITINLLKIVDKFDNQMKHEEATWKQ